MKLHGVSQLPVMEDESIVGIVTETALLERALRGGGANTAVREVAQASYTTVDPTTEITVVTSLFKRSKVAVVVENGAPVDIITRIDLIDHISTLTSHREGV